MLPYESDATVLFANQGFNDEPLRRDITRMYRLAYPILSYVAPRLAAAAWAADTPVLRAATAAAPPVLSRRIRVGFVSDHLSEHSVGKMITRLITFLPRSMFHVTVLRFLGATGWVRRAIDAAADVVVQLPEAQSTTSITECVATAKGVVVVASVVFRVALTQRGTGMCVCCTGPTHSLKHASLMFWCFPRLACTCKRICLPLGALHRCKS